MLTIDNLSLAFGQQRILRGISLHIQAGDIMCLLGPSGCGKTTLLRAVAGLEKPTSGDIQLKGQSILNIPVHLRDFGLMFQDFALFPHMNVEQNIEFGMRMQHVPRRERGQRVQQMLELVGLSGFGQRDVAQLSGGERQRVALARSLATKPQLLMLDEPLGSLDAALRERLLIELRTIIKHVGLTAIYVTHDQQEALALADQIAIMNAGTIEEVAPPERLYRQPETRFTAQFLGLGNILSIIDQHNNRATTVIGEFNIEGRPQALLLHPDGLQIVPEDTEGAFIGHVVESIFRGESYQLKVNVGANLLLTLKLPARAAHSPSPGEQITLHAAIVLPLR